MYIYLGCDSIRDDFGQFRRFLLNANGPTDGPKDRPTDGPMDGPTDGPTDGRTDPHARTHLKTTLFFVVRFVGVSSSVFLEHGKSASFWSQFSVWRRRK